MSEEEIEQRSCGCPWDYHLSDCPIRTARFEVDPWEHDCED